MSDPTTPPPSIHVDNVGNLMGALYIAGNLNWFFFGTLVIQFYNYIHAFPNDRKIIKIVVFSIFILDCIQTGLTTSTVWDYLVKYWGNTIILLKSPGTGISVALLSSLIGMIVQFFFAWRIWSLKRSSKIYLGVAGLIVAVAITQCISAWVSAWKYFLIRDVSELSNIIAGFTLWLSASLACDIFIAAAMVKILTDARRQSPFKSTDTVISRMVAHTIQTGAVTAVAAAVEIALFVRFPADHKHEVPAFVLGKLYSNCLLATLNARQGSYLSTPNETGNASDSMTLHGTTSFGSSARRLNTHKVNGVTVETVTVQDVSRDAELMDPHRIEMKSFAPYNSMESKNSYGV